MKQLRSLVKSLLPVQVRHLLQALHRDFVFWRAMKRFLNAPEACTQLGSPVLAGLIYGWGNEDWSALDEYLVGCIKEALSSDGAILECGSGLSTIVVGAIAQQRGLSHWALEHNPEWATKVQTYLSRYKIDAVTLCSKPLQDYGAFSWYAPPLEQMPDRFALIVCDGPPGSTKGGRVGLVPIMKEKLKPGLIILLDDAAREQERAIAKRWEAELGASSEIIGCHKPYIKMIVTGSRSPQTTA